MANWYVLPLREQKKFRIAVHVSTPPGNNKAGVPYAKAMILSGMSPGVSVVRPGDGSLGTIDPIEQKALADGTRYEQVFDFTPHDDFDALSADERRLTLTHWRTVIAAELDMRIREQLDYFGL